VRLCGEPLRIVAYGVSLLVALPILIILVSSLTAASYVTFPPQGYTLKWYAQVLRDPYVMRSLKISTIVAAITAALAVLLGLGVGFALHRHRFRGQNLVSSFVMAPLTLPTIVLALGMVFFMSAIGLIGSIQALVVGHLVVAVPYAVRTLSASIEGVNRDIERSAAVLGAHPGVVLFRITLPLMKPGLAAALMFSFLVSFNNVSISLFIAGPTTQTLPLTIFRMTQDVQTPNLAAIAALVMIFTTAAVLFLERAVGLYGVLERQRVI
jgi:putative spermidine/putrescine transport system permease protein